MKVIGTVIAKGAPNRVSDGRTVMCAILVSEEIGLVRVFPLHVTKDYDVKIWSVIECDGIHSQKDNRTESLRINSVRVIRHVESEVEKANLMNSCCLKTGTIDPLDYMNERKASIFVIRCPERVGAILEPRETVCVDHEIDEDDAWVTTQCEFPYKPYITWQSIQGVTHKTHLCGQEVYYAMMKNASTPFRVFENMRFGDPDYVHWLVMGNMNNRRTVWLAAHVHRQKKTASVMTSNLLTFAGSSENWPYLQQEAINVRCVNPQKTFEFTI